MTNTDSGSAIAAEFIESSATGLAGFTASDLLDTNPEIVQRYAPSAHSLWMSHLRQRLLELAAAMRFETPRVFVARVLWFRQCLASRDESVDLVRVSLACLQKSLEEQLPAGAFRATADYFTAAFEALSDPSPSNDAALAAADEYQRLALEFLHDALEGKSRAAVARIVEAAGEMPLDLVDAYTKVLAPAMTEVGRLWQLGELFVAEEHVVTSTAERVMAVLAHHAPRKADLKKTVISASVAGNIHHLGTRMLADLFEVEGWRSVCLGANVPSEDLVRAASFFEADLVLMSAALATQISEVESVVATLRESLPQVKILVGGLAFVEVPELWERIGADGYAETIDVALGISAGWISQNSE